MKEELYFISDLEKIINRHRLTLRRWWEKGSFPKPICLPCHRLAWHKKTIDEWLENTFFPNKKDEEKEAFESLSKEIQDWLLKLKNIPGALDRLLALSKDYENFIKEELVNE